MKKIINNIEDTWWGITSQTFRNKCREHVRTNDNWRYGVTIIGVKTNIIMDDIRYWGC